jgi:cell division protein FtsQ
MVIVVALVLSMSLGFILIHDLIIQSDYFRAKNLIVTGTRRLSADQILEQAEIRFRSNILALNLSVSRKRLLAHPWIAEAAVRREIPDKIRISIKEHRPLAVVDLGRKFLISDKSILFKEKEISDPENLPLIRGLRYSDMKISGEKTRFRTEKKSPPKDSGAGRAVYRQTQMNPLDAVMEILHLGLNKSSVLPNGRIKQIRVDKDIGLTLYPADTIREIRLGYHEYSDKYAVLREVFKYIKNGKINHFADFDSIDLNNLNRVVLVPVKTEKPAKDRKEV